MKRKFVCFFHFVNWNMISLGVSISLKHPHIEIHIPFGFVQIGMNFVSPKPVNYAYISRKIFGLGRWT